MRRFVLLMILLALATPVGARAGEPVRQGQERDEKAGTLTIVSENDAFYSLDSHYTNGLRFIWVPGSDVSAPRWLLATARILPWFPADGTSHHAYALGQSMFTPSDISLDDPPRDDQPYAGWLYGMMGVAQETERQLDQLALTVGMVGPSSCAEQSQKSFHRIFGGDQPQGWDTQLHNELGVIVANQRSWRSVAQATILGGELDVTPHLGGVVGNVYTHANTGFTLRYGSQLPDDYDPPLIQPGLPGFGRMTPYNGFGWYLFAGVDGRLVGRNIFLDGNTFRDSRSVDKYPLVGELQFGCVLDWSTFRLSYTHVMRSREFRTQDGSTNFGAVSLTMRF